MARHVDLSAPELHPAAVLRFIREHTDERPPMNVLFKVSEETFREYRPDGFEYAILVSEEEAAEMNEFLQQSWLPEDYRMDTRIECPRCGRLLNFYDVYQTGRKRHGDTFIKETLAGGNYHVQVADANEVIEIDCTACGTRTTLRGQHTYHAQTYCYA
jgi:hypothetical protein